MEDYIEHSYGKADVIDMAKYKINRENKEMKSLKTMLENRKKYTPDFRTLSECNGSYFPLFVYGEERESFKEAFCFDNNEDCFFGKVSTRDADYLLLENRTKIGPKWLGVNFLAARTLSWPLAARKKIFGELWGVPLKKLCAFDNKYENGVKSVRHATWVSWRDVFGVQRYTQAWAYMFEHEFIESFPKFGINQLHMAPFQMNSQGTCYHSIDTVRVG